MSDPEPGQNDMKERLLAELKQQLAAELKDELMSELKAGKKTKKAKKEGDSGETRPDDPVGENAGVLSSTGKLGIPKHVLKQLGWKKGDVIELTVEGGKVTCEKVGHTSLPSRSRAKTAATKGDGEEKLPPGPAGVPGLNVSEYIEFDFGERHVLGKVKQILENAHALYESGNAGDGLKVLEMIEAIELAGEEPDRSKMRMAVVKFVSSMVSKHPSIAQAQLPVVFDIIDKINSRYLKEKAYCVVGAGCKEVTGAKEHFDLVLSKLVDMLGNYQDTEMYAIVSLLENIIKLVSGTDSPVTAQIKEFMEHKFSRIQDTDYKIRIIKLMTALDAFKEAKSLARQFKETTTEGSSERRAVLDALKENREREKAYFEAHPELQPDAGDDDDDDDYEEEPAKKGGRKRAREKAPREVDQPASDATVEGGEQGENDGKGQGDQAAEEGSTTEIDSGGEKENEDGSGEGE